MFISKEKYNKALIAEYKSGVEEGERTSSMKRKTLEIQAIELKDRVDILEAENKVLTENKVSNIKLAEVRLENETNLAKIKVNQKLQSEKAKELEDRAKNLTSEEEANYKKGYADGVSDGLRKIHEMTAKDRDNLAKIAMISAASHTSIENMKEVNNEFRLTEGSTDKKTK